MKRFYKIFILICFFVFSLLFLTSKGYSYYGFPTGYSYPTTSQYQPPYPYSGSYPVVSIYPSLPTPSSSTPGIAFTDLAVDKDYIYSLARFESYPLRGQPNSHDLVIFQSISDESSWLLSDDYEYLSHIRLCEGVPPTREYWPHKIVVQDDLTIIGTMGSDDEIVQVFIVDVSDKENPKMLSSLDLPHHFPGQGTSMYNVSGIAIENHVLYLSVSYRYNGTKTAIYSFDISNPEGMDENESLLDLMAIEYEIYDMVSTSNYLYLAGIKADTENQEILIVNTSNPSNISMSGICNLGGIKGGKTNMVVNGVTLFAVVQASGETDLDVFHSDEESSSVLKIIDVSNPEQPQIVSSSVEVEGRPGTPHWGHELIVMRDNYAYILTRDGECSKIHVFNISNLKNPNIVNTEEVNKYPEYSTPRDKDSGVIGLYFVNEKLYHHAGEKINVFDISNPLDLSITRNMDLLVNMLAGRYDIGLDGLDLEEYSPYSPPSPWAQSYGYGGYSRYGVYDPYPSLYGYGGYSPYPSYGYGFYGGYGSYPPPIQSPTLISGPVVHIDEINIEGGLHIGELHLGSTLSSPPYVTASFISPSRGSAFADRPYSLYNSNKMQPQTYYATIEDAMSDGHLLDSSYQQNCLTTYNTPLTNDTQNDYLPHMMKGYELYSWPIGDKWYFSLLPGTNRLKSSEEILSMENDIDSIKSKLRQLPEGEYVFWIDETWLEQVQGAIGNFVLPDKSIIEEIKNLCEELNLELSINDFISDLSPEINSIFQ